MGSVDLYLNVQIQDAVAKFLIQKLFSKSLGVTPRNTSPGELCSPISWDSCSVDQIVLYQVLSFQTPLPLP